MIFVSQNGPLLAANVSRLSSMAVLGQLLPKGSVPQQLAILSLAVVFGLLLGAVRIRGVRIGVAAVLFSALAFGQIGLTIEPNTLNFLRDFALIIFAYSMGLEVGPSFFTSLRSEGLRLNLLSLAVIAIGALMTGVLVVVVRMSHSASCGLFAGAFTSTPALASGQEVLRKQLAGTPDNGAAALAASGLAYAVTYPFGVVGPILVIILLRKLCKIDVKQERVALIAQQQASHPTVDFVDLEVTNPLQCNRNLRDHPMFGGKRILVSRLLRDGVMTVPNAQTVLRMGDTVRAIGLKSELDALVELLGHRTVMDLTKATGDVQREDLVVTRTQVLRKTLSELNFAARTEVTIVGVIRAGVAFQATSTTRMHFGDTVTAVGPAHGLKIVSEELGNSADMLNRPKLLPIFLGIVLGVIVGSIPLKIPGLHLAMSIGLAGGPLLAAIALAQAGNIGSVVWYMPVAANQLFRDFGLAVFLACVGLQSGSQFWQRLIAGGWVFAAWGIVVTFVPVFAVGLFARMKYRTNFVTLTGWIAGAMTSTPALIFANDLTDSNAPALAYAAVAPLALLAPVLCGQILAMALSR